MHKNHLSTFRVRECLPTFLNEQCLTLTTPTKMTKCVVWISHGDSKPLHKFLIIPQYYIRMIVKLKTKVVWILKMIRL
jgi:hypothetical protein